jgi:ankyrin repeat protein
MRLAQKGPFRKTREKITAFFIHSKPEPDVAANAAKQKLLDVQLHDQCYGLMHGLDDTESILGLLKAGANPNARDSDGMTAFIYAAWGGNHEVVKAMLALGADANAQDNQKMTALMLAAQQGHLRTVRVLLAKGANVNIMAEKNKNALMMAAESGYIKTCRLLIRKGADANAIDSYGKTAMALAIANKHRDVSNMLSRIQTRIFERMLGKEFFLFFMADFKSCIA